MNVGKKLWTPGLSGWTIQLLAEIGIGHRIMIVTAHLMNI